MRLDRARIVRAATCVKGEVFEVRSNAYDRLLGAAETEGEAWELFFQLLDEVCEAYKEGSLVGYERVAAQVLGRKGGSSTSKVKRLSSAENGKKGGRPRKQSKQSK